MAHLYHGKKQKTKNKCFPLPRNKQKTKATVSITLFVKLSLKRCQTLELVLSTHYNYTRMCLLWFSEADAVNHFSCHHSHAQKKLSQEKFTLVQKYRLKTLWGFPEVAPALCACAVICLFWRTASFWIPPHLAGKAALISDKASRSTTVLPSYFWPYTLALDRS